MGGAGGPFGGQAQRGPAHGRDLQIEVTIDFHEAVFGTSKDISVNLDDACEHCGGNGAEPGTSLKACPTCKGKGTVTRVSQTILGAIQQTTTCATCQGRGKVPEKPCTVCHGSGIQRRTKKLNIKIPAGIDDGSTIRLAGQGAAPHGGGPKGDLYVEITVRPDRRFIRRGRDILSEASVPMVEAALGTDVQTVRTDRRFIRRGRDILSEASVPMVEAALGTDVQIETVDGPVTLKVPAGTQSGKVFKLSSRGVPALGGSRARGDHLVTVTVTTPTKLSARQRELLEEFHSDSGKKGFFRR
jgi:molecular chaperone DnaJ